MAGARAVVAQGRLAGHHDHHPLEEEKLVAGAEVVTGIAGSEERLEVAEMVGVDHDHHPLQEEKLVAGAGAEGCVEGLKGWSGREGIWRTSISSSTNCWLTWPKPLSVMNLDVSSKAAWQLTTRMTKSRYNL